MKKNLPKKSKNIDLDLLQIDPKSLKRDLQELHSIIDNFEDTNDNLGYKLGDMIESLSKKKGKIFWIEVEKDPKPKELLDISREIVKQTNINFIGIDNKITDLHNTDKEIFKLLCILAGLSGMTYTRIKDAFEVIDDAQKIIDENCDVTSEQGKRIMQIAQMHLQRIIEDKKRYEEIDAFLTKYSEVLDSLVQQFGSLDQHIKTKQSEIDVHISDENKRLEVFVKELQELVNTEIEKQKNEAISRLEDISANVEKQLSNVQKYSAEVIQESEKIKDQLTSISSNSEQRIKTKEEEIVQRISDANNQLNLNIKNLLDRAITDLTQTKSSYLQELEKLYSDGKSQLSEAKEFSNEILQESGKLRNQMANVTQGIKEQENKFSQSLSQRQEEFNSDIEKHTANFVNLCTQNKEEIDRDFLAFKNALEKSYQKKFIIVTALAITLSGIISLAIKFLL